MRGIAAFVAMVLSQILIVLVAGFVHKRLGGPLALYYAVVLPLALVIVFALRGHR